MSALLGRIPSAMGYQPTLATDLGGLQEQITTTQKGSITTFAHLDATTVLSRQVGGKSVVNVQVQPFIVFMNVNKFRSCPRLGSFCL